MANRKTIYIDGKSLDEFKINLIDYKDPIIAIPKDGGGKDVEGIDGLIATNSKVMKHLTGSLEISIESEDEHGVQDYLRQFKQFMRSGDFRQFSTEENVGFYRLGKLGACTSYQLTEVPQEMRAIGIYTFEIIYLDGYEYSSSLSQSSLKADGITTKFEAFFSNDGKDTRLLNIELSSINQVEGEININIFTKSGNDWASYDYLIIGKKSSTIIEANHVLHIDFSEPELSISPIGDTAKDLKFSRYQSGQFFKIPSGDVKIEITKHATTSEINDIIDFDIYMTVQYQYY